VGKSLAEDPALKGLRLKPAQERTGASVKTLDRLLSEGVLRYDGGEHLTEQILAVRTVPGAEGRTHARLQGSRRRREGSGLGVDSSTRPVGRQRSGPAPER
jgi:hypothetical protein